jgi:hypothetical protein
MSNRIVAMRTALVQVYAVYLCLICMPYMYALYVCLICLTRMSNRIVAMRTALVQVCAPNPYTLYLYTLIPSTLYPIPYTLYPIPYTLYPIPYTLYPIPYTLYLQLNPCTHQRHLWPCERHLCRRAPTTCVFCLLVFFFFCGHANGTCADVRLQPAPYIPKL